MNKGPETPIILWVCAAVCAHIMFAGGGDQVATFHDDKSFIYKLASDVRGKVKQREQVIEVVTSDDGKPKEEEPPEGEKAPKPELKKEAQKPEEKPKAEEKPKVEEKPKAPEVKVTVKEEDPAKKLDQVPLKQDKRIAVKQHVDPKQQDNPNARFIADQANTVKDESVATQTSHDQDDKNPTPAGQKTAGPKDRQGDSQRTKIAESEEHKGEKDKAPGEKGTEFDVQKDNKPIDKPMAANAQPNAPTNPEIPKSGGDNKAPAQVTQKETPPQLAPGAPPAAAPDVNAGTQGFQFNPIRPGAQASNESAVPGTSNQQKPVVPNNPANTKWLGLGGTAGPGQVNLNLNQKGVVAIVGADQLRKEREADGERRKSEHRGSWTASNFERWRNAIENYVSSVKPGNQTALNTAAVPFASYLNTIHNRIHPIFADSFLGSLDNLPKTHPLNDTKLVTRLEVVVSPKEGRIVKLGVVKTSGITAFDIAALDAVHRAQPFGPAPGAIVSPDGNVYLHWEFHRDEVYACSTMHARPFLLNTPPKSDPAEPQPPGPAPKSPSQEKGAPPPVNIYEKREGALPPPRNDVRG